MRVTFFTCLCENLGVGQLAAALKARGHVVSLVCEPLLFGGGGGENGLLASVFDTVDRSVKRVIASRPELLAVSTTSGYYSTARRVARQVKSALGVPVAVGGAHPTLVPGRVAAEKCFDYVFEGEADLSFPGFVDALAAGAPAAGTPGLWSRDGSGRARREAPPVFPADLDALPWADKEVWGPAVTRSGVFRVQTSRDCAFSCTYCSGGMNRRMFGVQFRRRSPQDVIEEITARKRQMPFRCVSFLDAVFHIGKKWLAEFCAIYRREVKLPFSCQGHPLAMDRETAFLLRDAGCREITIGVQSLNPAVRKNWLGRDMTNADIMGCLDHLEAAGIPFMVDHIIDAPGSRPEDILSAMDLYARYRFLTRIKAYSLLYFPRFPVTEMAREAGLLDDRRMEAILDGNPSGPSESRELTRLGKALELFPALPPSLRERYAQLVRKPLAAALAGRAAPLAHLSAALRESFPTYRIFFASRARALL